MKDLKVTYKNAILAHCHRCMGYYLDGRQDCLNSRCPFYTWMPFRLEENQPDLEWIKYHPKRVGEQLLSECGPSEEQRKILADRMRKLQKESKKEK